MVLIREAKPEDAYAISTLIDLAMEGIYTTYIFNGDKGKAYSFLKRFISGKDNQYSHQYIYVAEENNVILGQICIYPAEKIHQLCQPINKAISEILDVEDFDKANDISKGEVYIDTLAVKPVAQGKGIGSLLLNFIIDKYRNDSGRILSLLVIKDNQLALNLYLKLGFEIVSEKEHLGKEMYYLQLKF